MIQLHDFNNLPRQGAIEELRKCCGAERWCERMADSRPFKERVEVLETARRTWESLGREDWYEAFKHHPRIGGMDELKRKFTTTANWASQEQGKVIGASDEILKKLESGNARYEERFGHIFLVCATGRSAEEMLEILESRIHNDPETELAIAANEQAKITRLRLEKLIS